MRQLVSAWRPPEPPHRQGQCHDNPATDEELAQRMRSWIDGRYTVTVIERQTAVIGHAVWRRDEDGVYLRQFLIARDHRRAGVGSRAYALMEQQWGEATVKLDVLLHNERGIAFWRALGFQEYSTVLRRSTENA